MKKIFIDSSAFIALTDRSESNHESAVDFVETLPNSVRLVTSNFILDESVTRVRTLLGVGVAYQLGKEILSSKKYDLISVTDEVCRVALEKMKKFRDKRFSFTDCTSFVLMEILKIEEAFAFDDDFTKVGFQIHPSNY